MFDLNPNTSVPCILIIHLKRFNQNGTKIKNPLDFDEEIQVDSDYIAMNPNKHSQDHIVREYNHIYKLYAVIVHEGYSTRSGHYYSFIKNQDSNIWYKYDDENVRPVGTDLSSVKRLTQNAYILFYNKNYLDDVSLRYDHRRQTMELDHRDLQVDHPKVRSRGPSFYR